MDERPGRATEYAVLRRSRAWTAPWRLTRILRARRSIVPKPATYLWAAMLGAALGIGAELVLGWPWWLVAVMFVATVALFFLSSAFWPRGLNLNRAPFANDLLRVFSPRRARKRDDRDMIKRLEAAPFPLYGVPPSSWRGPRFLSGCVGGWSGHPREYTDLALGHGNPLAHNDPRLLVQVGDGPVLDRLLAMELGVGEPSWSTATIQVDSRTAAVEWLAVGDEWVAHTTVGDNMMILRGRRMPITSVELVRITDLEPYVDGQRRLELNQGS